MLRNYTPKFGSDVGANHQFAVNPFLVSAEERVSLKFKPRLFGPIESTEDFLYTLEVLENATETRLVKRITLNISQSIDTLLRKSLFKISREVYFVHASGL